VELERHPSLERVHSSESVHPDEAERAVTPSIMADIHDSPSSSEFRAEKGRPRTKE